MTISPSFSPIVAAALESASTVVAVLVAGKAPAHGPCFSEASGSFLQFTGYSEHELIGQPLGFLAAPDAAMTTAFDAALQSHAAYRGDLACRVKDGSQKWLGLHLMPVIDQPGQLRHYVLIGRDVTAQRKENAQMRLVQGLLLKNFMILDRALAMVAADNRIIMANAMLENLLGVTPGALAGTSALNLVLPPYRQLFHDARAASAPAGGAAGGGDEVEMEMPRPGGLPVAAGIRFVHVGCQDGGDVDTMYVRPLPGGLALPVRLRTAGKVRLIRLDTVRAELSGKWDTVADRVLGAAEQRIRARLQPEDLLTRTADKGFVICFANATEADASETAAAIARDIRQHLIGSGNENTAQLSAIVSQVKVPASGAPDMRRIGHHMQAVETQMDALPWPDPIVEAVVGAADGYAAGHFVRIEPPRQDGVGCRAFPDSTFEQDVAALRAAAALSTPTSLLVDLGFSTFLSRPAMDRYLHTCSSLPQGLRERLYLVFAPLPKGTTQAVLQDVMRRLSACCAGFGIRLDDVRPPEFDLATCRPAVAVVDMRRWEGGRSVPIERLHRATSLMHSYRARVLGLGVTSAETGRELLRSGVDWITLS